MSWTMFSAHFHAPGKSQQSPCYEKTMNPNKAFFTFSKLSPLLTLMHLFSRHDLEPVTKDSSQSQQINISKQLNLLWKSLLSDAKAHLKR